ncbi:MAG TPA: formyltransferase family protein [Saprospiraceae bacterium]
MPSEVKAHLAIFASGAGSNADKICTYFKDHPTIRVKLVISNKADAGVLSIADKHGIESAYISKKYWSFPELVLPILETADITHIILAGYLSLIPSWLIEEYNGRIVNIHPALLPKHGGKGMYGHYVHEAVKSAGELVSGITIHEVNEHYDSGSILFQKEVELASTDTPDDIAHKVLVNEHAYYARVIEAWILGDLNSIS